MTQVKSDMTRNRPQKRVSAARQFIPGTTASGSKTQALHESSHDGYTVDPRVLTLSTELVHSTMTGQHGTTLADFPESSCLDSPDMKEEDVLDSSCNPFADKASVVKDESDLEDDDPSKPQKLYWLSEAARDRQSPGSSVEKLRVEELASGYDISPILRPWYENGFYASYQDICKIVGKIWIKFIHPKRQTQFPYKSSEKESELEDDDSEARIPEWWPEGVTYKEPDHLSMTGRVKLLMHIFLDLTGKWMTDDGQLIDAVDDGPVINAETLLAALERDKSLIMNDKNKKGELAWDILWDMCKIREKEENYVFGDYYPGAEPIILKRYSRPLPGARGKRKAKPDQNSVKRIKPETNLDIQIATYQPLSTNHTYPDHQNYTHDWSSLDSPFGAMQLSTYQQQNAGNFTPASTVVASPSSFDNVSYPQVIEEDIDMYHTQAYDANTHQPVYSFPNGMVSQAYTSALTTNNHMPRAYMQQQMSIATPTVDQRMVSHTRRHLSSGMVPSGGPVDVYLLNTGRPVAALTQKSEASCDQMDSSWSVDIGQRSQVSVASSGKFAFSDETTYIGTHPQADLHFLQRYFRY